MKAFVVIAFALLACASCTRTVRMVDYRAFTRLAHVTNAAGYDVTVYVGGEDTLAVAYLKTRFLFHLYRPAGGEVWYQGAHGPFERNDRAAQWWGPIMQALRDAGRDKKPPSRQDISHVLSTDGRL